MIRKGSRKKILLVSLGAMIGIAGVVTSIVTPVLVQRHKKNQILKQKYEKNFKRGLRVNELVNSEFKKEFPNEESYMININLSYKILKQYDFNPEKAKDYVVSCVQTKMFPVAKKALKNKEDQNWYFALLQRKKIAYLKLPTLDAQSYLIFKGVFISNNETKANGFTLICKP